MPTPGEKLRALIDKGEHFVAAEAYSALTGRIVQHVGFPAAYLGGHACSAFHYAVPDNGIYSQVEQIEQAGRIAQAMDIPLIADADTLGETVADAFHFTRRYVQAGVAGVHVEDEVNPKHSKHVNGLCSVADMQCRIEASRKAAGDSGFVIIARCDELYPSTRGGGGGGSIEEAIRRGKAYAEAGADALVFPIASPEAHQQIIPEMPVPVCTLGFNLPDTLFTLSTGWGWVSAAVGHLRMARELMETGAVASAGASFANFPEKYDLIDQNLYDELIVDWAEKTGRPTRPNHAP
ncbi:isocitrate lyase/PEP mutase family protein [Novosphingobium album (ex Liu et al. 2023)]|uniref:Isocitrate lyase/PEP mutase family protein n=1 Tax=Novosphingobium album (ex Liu et al. 2023) TaxID=3031130 RepID=A0ABT5WTM7_9SPHN|nr:isocitrate lyase/PEP mutase family protein [Novosphingobium album (ex Liu et al. 2023)]MDE8653234.1 isocitrate lyase/PEP mutase family protein [Novosphingobium album (ex Liu et al. 2023)]